MQRQQILDEINRRLKKHPGDAPWSCIECYHNKPCVEKEILMAAKAHLTMSYSECLDEQARKHFTG